jgi:tRNA A-37 threonylcarbamoyl transferase component Bud32
MTRQASCPDRVCLQQLLGGTLPDNERGELTGHVETCENCQRTLDALIIGSASWAAIARQVEQEEPEPEEALRRVMEEIRSEISTVEGAAEAPTEDPPALDFLSPPDKPGQLGRLGHYEVVEVLGRGGMGIVLKAFDAKLHRIVAIKVMAPQLATAATARKRFLREAQAAAAVRHEHVIDIHAVEEVKGLPYLVMEYVAGVSLEERLNRGGPLELKEVLRIGMQTAAGLAAAHAQGLVHRDVKPANILLENGVERVKITDFGLARAADDASLTQSGVVAGTPQYMAPEQARGEAVDHRADLFSLGSVLYAMCTGRVPFRASGSLAVLKRVCEDTPRPIPQINPEIPPWLVEIITRLQAKKPADRFASAAAVAERLGQHLAHLQQPTLVPLPPREEKPATGPMFRGERGSSQRRWLAVGVIAALLVAGAIWAAPQIIVRIRGKDGQTTELKVPEGAQVEVEQDGKVVATVPRDPIVPYEIRRFEGHTAGVGAVAFSADGRQALSGDYAKTVIHWDVETGRELRRFEHPGVKLRVAYSPKGAQALVCADEVGGEGGLLLLWDLKTGKELRRVHEQAAGRPAFSPDGRRALCPCADKTIRLWDLETGKELQRLEGHQERPLEAVFSPDGRYALSGSGEKTARYWDLETGKELKCLEGHRGWVPAVAIAPDGRRAVSGSAYAAHVWDLETGKEVRQLVHSGTTVLTVAVSPDGRLLLTGTGEFNPSLRLWDLETGQELHRFPGYTAAVRSVAFSPDGRYGLSGSWDGTVRLWRLPPAK